MDLNNLNTKKGVITLMYHRFNENKYPSTNVRNEIFVEHLKEIKNSKIEFITFEKFKKIPFLIFVDGYLFSLKR